MPPRYVYWTIIVDGQPTAFRSGSLEDIMPTFNRLKEKQPSAELKWFQNGQLWASRHDAQDFMRARGERGRAKDPRQGKDRDPGSGTRDPRAGDRPSWVPKDKSAFRPDPGSRIPDPGSRKFDRPAGQARSDRKPEWKPKGTFKPKEAGHASGWGEKPGWKQRADRDPGAGSRDPRSNDKSSWAPNDKRAFRPDPGPRTPDPGRFGKPAWKGKPSGSARDQARSSFRPKAYTPKTDDGMTRSSRVQSKNDKLEWKPKGDSRPSGPNSGFSSRGASSDAPGSDGPKRKWVPKADYKKSLGIEAKKDSKWRPGGDHVDPKQKYKDAKKAKWGKFKANIRARSTKPRKREE